MRIYKLQHLYGIEVYILNAAKRTMSKTFTGIPRNINQLWHEGLFWNGISEQKLLDTGFIDRYSNKLNWRLISLNHCLSKNFINKYKSELSFDNISINNSLNEDIIRSFKDVLNWRRILNAKQLSSDFLLEHLLFLSPEEIGLIRYTQECHIDFFLKLDKGRSGENL